MRRSTKLLFAVALVAFFAACTTTHLTSSWTAKNEKPREYKKLLVLGIIADTTRVLRQTMETALVDELKAKGVNAVSAFEEYGPQAFNQMDEKKATAQIKSKGFDGVITISLLNKKKEKVYVPGTSYQPYGWDYPFWGYYSYMYTRVYEPGYYDTDIEYIWESNLYNLNNGKLLYSAQSESFNPASYESLGRQYGKTILKDLVKNELITKK